MFIDFPSTCDECRKLRKSAESAPDATALRKALELIIEIQNLDFPDLVKHLDTLSTARAALLRSEPREDSHDGVERIRIERERQKAVEGWTADHDDAHSHDELARVAACYALPAKYRRIGYAGILLPCEYPLNWHRDWWKPCPDDRIRELEKAGALIAAEIDRLLRSEPRGEEPR